MFLGPVDENGLLPPGNIPNPPLMEPMAIFCRLLSMTLMELNMTKNVSKKRKSEANKYIVIFMGFST